MVRMNWIGCFWPLLFLALVLCPVWSSQVRAASFTVPEIIESSLILKSDYMPPDDLTEIYNPPVLEKPGEMEDVESMLMALIYFESLEGYSIYNPRLKGNLPLGALAQMLFALSIEDDKYPLRILISNRKKDEGPSEGFTFLWARPRLEEVRGLKYISDPSSIRTPTTRFPQQKSNFMEWLTEDEGLFSGSEWTWNNAMQRLLTVAGFILVALLGTEAVRYLLGLGQPQKQKELTHPRPLEAFWHCLSKCMTFGRGNRTRPCYGWASLVAA